MPDQKDHTIEVQVVTTAGNYPASGFTEHNVNQKVQIDLNEAARALHLQNTASWVAKVDGRIIAPDLSYAENNLHGRIQIFWAPQERGGGLHPAAAEELFRTEVAALLANRALLDALHVWPLRWTYPELRLALQRVGSGNLRVARFLCDDWDEQPPSFALLDAETGATLPLQLWPQNASGQHHWHNGEWQSGGGIILTGAPFLCMRGIKEYHEHHQHVTDTWEQYRGKEEYTLAAIITRAIDAFQQSRA